MPGADDHAALRRFVADHGLENMPQLIDSAVLVRFGIAYTPAWVFINQDGEVQVHPGTITEFGLRKALADLRAG